MKKSYFRKFFLSFEGSKNFQNNFSTYTVSETLPTTKACSLEQAFLFFNYFLLFSFPELRGYFSLASQWSLVQHHQVPE